MDQVFATCQVCEKYLANGKDVFLAFMDLEKFYHTIALYSMWHMHRVYGVGVKLLKAMQSFDVASRECVWIGNEVIEWCFQLMLD